MALGSPLSLLLLMCLLSPLWTGISFLCKVVSAGHHRRMLPEDRAAPGAAMPVACVGAAVQVPTQHGRNAWKPRGAGAWPAALPVGPWPTAVAAGLQQMQQTCVAGGADQHH